MLDRRSVSAGSSKLKVLVVEDFEPFRQYLCVMLRNNSHIGAISEAGDGLTAVSRAASWKPDVVVTDIGLPKLNGLEAAKRIRRLSPHSKIIFVTQESSVEIVRETLSLGASGYLLKTDAGGELLAAFDAVLQDKRFVAPRLGRQEFLDDTSVVQSSGAIPQEVSACRPHDVVFYSDPARWVRHLAQFVGSALQAGDAAITVLTKSRQMTLVEQLKAQGVNLDAVSEQGRYVSLDASDLLLTFMVNGLPHRERLRAVVSDLATTVAKTIKEPHNSVVFCGECAPLLWSQGNAKAAIELEHLWNELARGERIHVLCAYPLESFHDRIGTEIFERICEEHSAVHSH